MAPGRGSASPGARGRGRRGRPARTLSSASAPGRRAHLAHRRRRAGRAAARCPPIASSSWSAAARAEAERPQPQRARRRRAAPRAAAPAARAGRRAEAVGRPSPCSTLQLPPPPSRAPRRSASSVLPSRWRGGEEAVDQQLQGAVELAARPSPPAARSPRPAPRAGARGRSGVVLAAGEAQRPQAERAEAIGDLVGRERRQRPQGADPEPPQGLDQLPGLAPRQAEPVHQHRDGKLGEERCRHTNTCSYKTQTESTYETFPPGQTRAEAPDARRGLRRVFAA